MDKEIICLDTSVFIDYFRKQKKEKTFLVELADNYDFAISVLSNNLRLAPLNLKDFERIKNLKIIKKD